MPPSQNILSRLLNRRQSITVTFLSRSGCHLCDEAEPLVLSAFGAQNVEVVNILEHSALEDQYVFRIPVILCDGRVIGEGVLGRQEIRCAKRAAIRHRREDQARA